MTAPLVDRGTFADLSQEAISELRAAIADLLVKLNCLEDLSGLERTR